MQLLCYVASVWARHQTTTWCLHNVWRVTVYPWIFLLNVIGYCPSFRNHNSCYLSQSSFLPAVSSGAEPPVVWARPLSPKVRPSVKTRVAIREVFVFSYQTHRHTFTHWFKGGHPRVIFLQVSPLQPSNNAGWLHKNHRFNCKWANLLLLLISLRIMLKNRWNIHLTLPHIFDPILLVFTTNVP